jgi:hypothetical protein
MAAAGQQAGFRGKDEEDASLEVITGKSHDPPFYHRCKSVGHLIKECRQGWGEGGHRRGNFLGEGGGGREEGEYVAPLCVLQVDGQAFFYISDRPSPINAKERVNTAIVTVLKGEVTTT